MEMPEILLIQFRILRRILRRRPASCVKNSHLAMSDFIPHTETYDRPPIPSSPTTREPIRIIVIGSTYGIDLIIGILHRLGFAEPRTWSKPQLDPVSGKPMRILTKWIRS